MRKTIMSDRITVHHWPRLPRLFPRIGEIAREAQRLADVAVCFLSGHEITTTTDSAHRQPRRTLCALCAGSPPFATAVTIARPPTVGQPVVIIAGTAADAQQIGAEVERALRVCAN